MIQGPDGAPFVLDRTTKSVYRIDPATRATRVFAAGTNAAGGSRRPRSSSPWADPRPARRRRPERRCGAGDRPTTRATARRRRSGSRTTAAGATTSGGSGRSCATPAPAVQPLRRRSVGAADPRLLPGQRRQRLPGRPDRSPRRRPRRVEGRRAVHRQRHLRRRRRPHRPVRRRPGRGLADRRAARLRCSASSPTTRCSRRRATSGPAASTPTTSRTSGSSRSTRRRARSSSSTASPGMRPAGRTCAGSYVVPAGEDAPPTLVWANERLACTRSILEAVPDVADGQLRRRRRPESPGPASGAARRLAAGLRRCRDPAPRREPGPAHADHHDRHDRRLRRGLRLHPGRRGQPGRSRASTSSSRRGASSRPSSSRPGRRATT